MTHIKLKEQALALRMKGMSYNQIREKVKVSKSTLSLWLDKYPLSKERLAELRATQTPNRERFRETMRERREQRIAEQDKRVTRDLGKLTDRELFVAGFFLFWGEGSKGRKGEVCLANTDPAMVRCYLEWLTLIGADRSQCHFTLHLYADMNPQKEISFWMKALDVKKEAFYKPYIKKSNLIDITYKNGFGHGTCNARYPRQELNDYVRMGLRNIRGLYEQT